MPHSRFLVCGLSFCLLNYRHGKILDGLPDHVAGPSATDFPCCKCQAELRALHLRRQLSMLAEWGWRHMRSDREESKHSTTTELRRWCPCPALRGSFFVCFEAVPPLWRWFSTKHSIIYPFKEEEVIYSSELFLLHQFQFMISSLLLTETSSSQNPFLRHPNRNK